MLACARIGAIHSVVFAGMGTQAPAVAHRGLPARRSSSARTSRSGAARRSRSSPRSTRPCATSPFVEQVVVHRRGSRPGDEPVTFESEREYDFYDIQQRARDPLPARADGRRGPALHPLHVRHDREAEGRRPHHGRLHGRRDVPRARLLPDRRARHLLVARPTSAGSSATRSSSTGRSRSARRSSRARACPTTRRADVTWELCERFGVNILFTAPTAVRMWMSHGAEAPAPLRPLAPAPHRLRGRAAQPRGAPLGAEAPRRPVGRHGRRQLLADGDRRRPSSARCPTFEARPGKVGKPLPGVVADVVDKDGKSLPDGHGGLLVLRAPAALHAPHRLGRPRALREVLGADPRAATRRATSRCATRDGYFAVLGRADDVMNVAGPPHRHRRRRGLAPAPPGRRRERRHRPARTRQGRAHQGVRRPARRRAQAGAGLIGSLKDHVRQDLGPIAAAVRHRDRRVAPEDALREDRAPLPEGGGDGRGPGRPLDARRLSRAPRGPEKRNAPAERLRRGVRLSGNLYFLSIEAESVPAYEIATLSPTL